MHPANSIDMLRTTAIDRAAARHLQRRRRSGELVRVRHGVYVERTAWEALDGRGRHLVRMRAVLPLLRPDAVWALDSAAAILGVPRLEKWPDRVHVVDPGIAHDLQRVGLTLHAGRPRPSGGRFHGVEYTDLAQTTVELARRGSFSTAVVVLDHALRHGGALDDLAQLALDAGPWGSTRVEHALVVCDPRHESVGESFFAARAAELGCPEMEPQHEFRYADGTVDRVDFWLPREGIVIEFDGRQKYEDPAMLGGRSGAEAVWVEKVREDRVRARHEVNGFVRVHWRHLTDPELLRAHLRQHRVPCH
ncbi:hypothetical protein [Curtobacterium sp. VKM Ac-2922]|uniref:hypothetical protein n=1 Tax=Curtobacterium sp. VKM Ac-2922 TaxID=2929475 RepID=UPI001FB44365|nr:hypothetical protein [Curtobacterium sp. VKM Ac-2922]MCJ1713492.1 hypothetical protein [Curtobacterium sp. VKM Ac-2922]